MNQAAPPVQHLTADKVATWYQQDDLEMVVGDALDPARSAPLVIGYARYRKGATNQLATLPYDEALIITRGVFTVRRADGVATATAGEVIFHRAGAKVVYQADEDAELVYVSHPALAMEQAGEEAGGGFHPAGGALAAQLVQSAPSREEPSMDNVAVLERIWGPMERGESTDYQPFFDLLDDDVVFTTSVGELRGKQAVIHYFTHAGELLEFRPYERPQEYFGNGDRVVIVGEETFRVRATGVTSRVPWAWVYTLDSGLITRIEAIEDLSAVADAVTEALARARAAAPTTPASAS
jgi:ethanolamine utilization protein EutQ